MTTLTGNICLVLAALISGTLITTVLKYKPPHGGSGGVAAFPIWVLLLHFIFLCVMIIAVIAIARKGGFDWIAPNKLLRYVLVAVGILATVYTSLISALVLERPQAESVFLRTFSQYALVVIPVILIITGFILLNTSLRESVPAALYKWPLVIVFGIAILGVVASIVDGISKSREGTRTQRYENDPSIIDSHIDEIDQADITRDLVRVLEFTSAIYPAQVREKARDKIKTHPSLQNELVALLENDRALEAFNFLSWNEVDDKNMFVKPVNTGVISTAHWIRASIQGYSPSDFHRNMYTDEVNRVLRTVEKFEGMGADYLPAVMELRSALDEPVPGKKIKFDCIPVLDDWISKHQ